MFLIPALRARAALGTRGDVILQLDWTIGEVMRTLDSLGIADQYAVGFHLRQRPRDRRRLSGRGGMRLGGHTPSGIYRGGKYSLYEAGNARSFHRAVALLCETGRAVRRLLADRRLPLARNADRRRPSRRSCPRQPQPPA